MGIHLEDEDIHTTWRGVKPSASTSPDDMGTDDAPPTDAPGQDNIPGAVDDAPPTDAPGQDNIPGAVDDAPPTDAPGQDNIPGAIDDPPPPG
jgi:hypothetical protein